MRVRRLSVSLASIAIILFGACHRPPSTSFALVLTESILTIEQGASGVVGVTLECDPGFVSTATLTPEALPAGVAAAFAPDALGCGGSSALTLEVDPTAQPGTYVMQVLGESDDAVAQVELTLIVAAVSTDFTLSMAPASLTIEQSVAATVTVTVLRSGSFADDVVLALEGAPSGIVGSFQPNPVSGSASSLSLQVGNDAAGGVHALTVVGSAGAATHSAPLTVTVTERGVRLVGIPSVVSVDAPSSTVVPIAIERTASFTEALTLTVEGAPPGVSGSFDPNPTTTTGSVLTLSVADTVGPGSYGLTVRAESPDGLGDLVAFSLVVAPAVGEGFDIQVEPASLTLKQGQQDTIAVSIERTAGFVDPVALSAVADPDAQHIGMTFDPALAADVSVMTVTIGINVPPRGYLVVVQGVGDGLVANATISLLVTGDD